MSGQVKVNGKIKINDKIKIDNKIHIDNGRSDLSICVDSVRRWAARLEASEWFHRDHRVRHRQDPSGIASDRTVIHFHIVVRPPTHAASARSRAKRGVCR